MVEYCIIDLLVVDDDDDFRSAMVRRFTARGFYVQEAPSAKQALELGSLREFDVAVFDMMMPGMSGIELLAEFKANHPECEVILLTGQESVGTDVKATDLGAFAFLAKPLPLKVLESHIKRAYDRRALCKENSQLRALLRRREPQFELPDESPFMREVLRFIEWAGPSDKPILIQGESGIGLNLVAQALHRNSNRATKHMVIVNCEGLPESKLEIELLGHEKGFYSGSIDDKLGWFELADESTLFIDDIGAMPVSLQAQLLLVLKNSSLCRVGSLKRRRVNVRLIAATHRDLATEVKAARFREDLLHHINGMSLELPRPKGGEEGL